MEFYDLAVLCSAQGKEFVFDILQGSEFASPTPGGQLTSEMSRRAFGIREEGNLLEASLDRIVGTLLKADKS